MRSFHRHCARCRTRDRTGIAAGFLNNEPEAARGTTIISRRQPQRVFGFQSRTGLVARPCGATRSQLTARKRTKSEPPTMSRKSGTSMSPDVVYLICVLPFFSLTKHLVSASPTACVSQLNQASNSVRRYSPGAYVQCGNNRWMCPSVPR